MQIIGTVKCRDTKKCRLWFDQRGISYHFVNLAKKPLGKRELKAIAEKYNWDDIINKEGMAWKKRQLEWKDYDPEEELQEEPTLLLTPVVRHGKYIFIGYKPLEWETLLQE